MSLTRGGGGEEEEEEHEGSKNLFYFFFCAYTQCTDATMLRGKVGGISVIRSMIFRRSIFSFFLFILYSTTVVVLFSQCASTRRNSRFPSSPVSFLPSFQVMIKMGDLDGYPRSPRTNSRELCRAEELSSRKGIVVDASKNVSRCPSSSSS